MAVNDTRTNGQNQIRFASDEGASATTDGSGDITHEVSELKRIESKADAMVQAEGGYTANVQSVSANSVTFRVFESAGSASSHSASTNTSVTYNIHARGY